MAGGLGAVVVVVVVIVVVAGMDAIVKVDIVALGGGKHPSNFLTFLCLLLALWFSILLLFVGVLAFFFLETWDLANGKALGLSG